jgi:putative iron-regulated protein
LLPSLVACDRGDHSKSAPRVPEGAQAMLTQYSEIAFASYSDAAAAARRFEQAVSAFVAEPSPEGLEATQRAWSEARAPYVQTEVFRFYDGPIDRVELLVNTWPIDENYIDGSVEPQQGIVNLVEKYPVLDKPLLVSLNEKESEKNVSTGFHAAEFLLWGRDTSSTGPGQRSALDFSGNDEAKRRGAYLKVVSELLVEHLSQVAAEWAPGRPNNYRARFLALPPSEALGLVLKGFGTLTGPELAGERLTVAYETKDQSNEHSCFSDTTHADVIANVLGMENVCLGRYVKVDGSEIRGLGLCELLSRADSELGARLRGEVTDSLTAARAIPAPFDQAILGADEAPGRKSVDRTIRALEKQAETLGRAASALGAKLALATASR